MQEEYCKCRRGTADADCDGKYGAAGGFTGSVQKAVEMLIAEMEENEALRNKLTKVSKKLSERTVKSDEPGSMAEIAMKMTGVFKSADEAAALYLNSIK